MVKSVGVTERPWSISVSGDGKSLFVTRLLLGTGLGLAVCYGLVTAHGGSIRAEPRSGGGSRFVIDLPGVVVGDEQGTAGARMKPTVLVVDDKANMLAMLTKVLGKSARVVTARGARTALELLETEPVTVVLCDLRMNDGDGLEVLRSVRVHRPGVPFILMTAYATVPTAVQAMREGAYDYVTKPFDPDELRALVERAIAQAVVENAEPPQDSSSFGEMIGRSPAMKAVYQMIDRVAPTDATVLILGETGTGKELVARAIHERSSRSGERLVAVNCAAIPRSLIESELFGHVRGSFTGAIADRTGLFEEATRSTLFLDEIGELRITVQAKLTRVLEERIVRRTGEARERKIGGRLVAATHRDLRARW